MRSRNLTAATIAMLAAMLLAGPALADKAKTRIGDVEIEVVGPPPEAKYSGAIKTAKRCRKGRRVKLIHDSDPPFTIGETTTDENGNWSITGAYPLDSGDDRIIVKVSKSKRCKGATGSFDFYDEEAED
jgi:hypothetical protein